MSIFAQEFNSFDAVFGRAMGWAACDEVGNKPLIDGEQKMKKTAAPIF